MSYIMKRYPVGYFEGIDNIENTTVYDQKLAQLKNDFPGYDKFATYMINRLKTCMTTYSDRTNISYNNMIFDIILSDNGNSVKGGIIPRQNNKILCPPKYTNFNTESRALPMPQFTVIRTSKEQDTYSSATFFLGFDRNGNYEQNFYPGRKMFLRPATDYIYGSFEGIYDFPYSVSKKTDTTWQCKGNVIFSTSETFHINGKQYMMGLNSGYMGETSNAQYYSLFLYRIE